MRQDYPEVIGALEETMRGPQFGDVAKKLRCYDFLLNRLENFT